MQKLFYLHGFRSGPQSVKAVQLRAHLARQGRAGDLWCEQLPPGPLDAIALIESVLRPALDTGDDVALAGSSLGGFYALHLAEKHGLHAALINPAVVAPKSLGDYVGEHEHMYTGEVFRFEQEHVDQLAALEVAAVTRPERYLVLLETGDEVLDWWQAVLKLRGANLVVHAGGDHSLQCFARELPRMTEFLLPDR
ncbi:YqiA/YcfP family alpha/beta fold hydrolase [Methyloversatilis sp.]|uniref:YqiA/YcfP family alpha/beta fold hydrolase n=1 Tax=Methyloversatilis sp. TaxID=2569862 RepID=UPI00273421A2|nr:YqiA/YcfP family alpha/beta fold hydrolase [Methyloversatilis sp.]MDP3290190.1 YqiA/YcfP family alpha/beta fold hydrolase [Methyloversatilis sp.]MDP3456320.1 YqiA/YcfP family alpha/beta fold hydrolase [Methyloversatilis sp.]MDP3579454.1 YqiA/YcfP family alpha/beta fold hydrolase [Methyloversatilis sp.]